MAFDIRSTLFGCAFLAILNPAGPVDGQIPDEFTNLQVLNADISRGELMSVMRGFSGALGVRCNFCHMGVDPSDFTGYDFASDEREVKTVARGMMRMLTDINGELIPAAGRPEHTDVGCVTCHGGIQLPIPLGEVILNAVTAEGVDAAVGTYRDLRADHYGGAAYDFGAGQLNTVTETLAQQGKMEEALTIIRLNIEFNDEAFPHFLEAEVLLQMGDREGAIRSMERAVELEPDAGFFRQQLERMRNPG